MHILVTGATGLIGSRLVEACLAEGFTIHYLTTRKSKIKTLSRYKGFYWNPESGEIDVAAIEGVTAVVHLAGASISDRWTKKNKNNILKSRTESAALLFDTLRQRSHTIERFISASGISIYPASFTRLYTEEDTEVDHSFPGQVVVAWEAAADRFKLLGMDVTKVRTGLVFDKNNGAFPLLKAPISRSVGAVLGSGKQWQSWIHVDDVTKVYLDILKYEWEGIFNAVAPNPVTNKRLIKQIALALNRSLWLPNVPAFVLKLVLGEMSMLVLKGQLVSSKKLQENGFTFQYFNLQSALQDLL